MDLLITELKAGPWQIFSLVFTAILFCKRIFYSL